MKMKGSLVILVGLIIFFFSASYPWGQTDNKEALITKVVLTFLQQQHFQPREVNDDLSKQMFTDYVNYLDGGRRFLTAEDMAKLNVYQTKLDNEMVAGTFEFFDESMIITEKGIEKSKLWYPEILSKPFDFTVNESLDTDSKTMPFPKNDAELEENWRKILKYEVLIQLSDLMDDQAKSKDGAKKTKVELEKDAREKVKKSYDDTFKNLAKVRRADRFSDYLNSLTSLFDPHSNYFSPKDKQDFDITMSGRLEGIGATLQIDGEYTKVSAIVPGGPAWKQKELEANDLIYKVQQSTGEPLDIRGMRLDDVVQKIRGKKGTIVILTVKKPNGVTKEVTIERDEVVIDEGYARSIILNYPGVIENVGYIKLQKFYADFESDKGNSCSVDVAKEIEKLKSQHVGGIILDLRNNGGGSLRDVVDMSGFFIEKGPIVQVKSRDLQPMVLSDDDPNVQYNGPLIVLVNEFSASASEILAAAIQDYGRGVIIGSKSTFGKGSVQRFLELDKAVRGQDELKPLGEIKVTTQKFYRVNGGSTQMRGVVPDIVLPDNYQYMKSGEKEYDHAMQWTEISPVPFSQSVYKIPNMSSLKSSSAQRVKNNEVFRQIDDNAKRLKTQSDEKSVSLNQIKFEEMIRKRKADTELYKNLFKENSNMKTVNLPQDMVYIQMDSSRIARNDSWVESIKKDVYLEESLQVMRDMLMNH
ncbi:MAG: carboxy terminal-processing peptidase [Saprospiraceae bacterium]